MNYVVYIMYWKFVVHVICSLPFMIYKYNKLQMSATIQKLSYKVSCRTPYFHNGSDLKIELDPMELKRKRVTQNKYIIYHTNFFPSKFFSNLAYSILLLFYPPCEILTLHLCLICLIKTTQFYPKHC